MKRLLALLICLALPLAAVEYTAKDYSHLLGMKGFTDGSLEMHFKLYQGYVTNTNLLLSIMKKQAEAGKLGSPEWSGLKRRFGWEWDGMRLHELYFSNLGGNGKIDVKGPLYGRIIETYGTYDSWVDQYKATGAMRGIGWAVLYQDPETGNLFTVWINEHNVNHLAGGTPLLIMDVWEHAYLLDYGLDRKAYIDAFMDNVDWTVVEKRYQAANRQGLPDKL